MHRQRQRSTAYTLFAIAGLTLASLALWLLLSVEKVKRSKCPKERVPVFYVARGTVECQLLNDENLAL